MARSYASVFVERRDTWRPNSDPAYPSLSLDTHDQMNTVLLHFGVGARPEPTLAVDSLEQLISAAIEMRNAVAAQLGRAPIGIRPDGPDDPTDDPDDEPATALVIDGRLTVAGAEHLIG